MAQRYHFQKRAHKIGKNFIWRRVVTEAMDKKKAPNSIWQGFLDNWSEQMLFANKELNAKGIENFVQETMKNYMPKTMLQQAGLHHFADSLDYELFETHQSIFIRWSIPADVSLKNIRFYVNSRILKIVHGDSSEEIALPHDVDPDQTSSKYDQGVLEISLSKTGDPEPFREIFIRDGGK